MSTTPGPRFRTPFAFAKVMRDDPLPYMEDCRQRFGDVVRVRFWPFEAWLVFHPDGVRRVLHENHRNYWKGTLLAKLKRIAGEGLVFSDGDLWRRQRQLVQPAFHRQRIDALAEMMAERVGETLDRWEATADSGTPLDVDVEMAHLTLAIVTRALFGTDLGTEQRPFADAITAGMAYANYLLNTFFPPPLFVPTPANLRARRAIATLDRIVAGVIAERRRTGADRPDLLGMLLAARDAETHATMTDKQLRDEIITFLVAGHETTAVALSWTWHLLARNAAVEERLHAEVDLVLGGRPARLEDLRDLPYTRMVLEEAMRLYPPVWGTSRETLGEDEIQGHRIPARRLVTVSPWVTHRHPDFWPDPERFDPERFRPEQCASRPEYAYVPFGGGPRGCIGRQFAMLEGQLALAMIAQRFRLLATNDAPIRPNPILTLRPSPRLRMTLERRHGEPARLRA